MLSVFLHTYALIFLAELGDKTQLATLAAASGRPGARLWVFLGAALALVTTSLLAVLFGDLLTRIPNAGKICKIASGVLFLVFGVLSLADAFKS
ncbi:MAG: TMEM165/GDT1 family protein [Kiritimatiellae bacterium]|nr:TMEM165/GDT1 family protein [Kiritimatiellia bacterium]